jgi:squalene-hopene/tetraprenyl-beta-curcumene cyclase
MSYQKLLENISIYGNQVKDEIKSLQSPWADLVSLEGDFVDPLETIYDCYPYLFRSLFPKVGAEELHRFSVAGRLFGASVILFDSFLDNGILGKRTRELFSPMAMQWESQKILNRLFEPEAIFWRRFDGFYQEHIRACTEEEEFRSGKRDLSEYTEETSLRITVGKNGMSRAVIAGMVELGGNEEYYAPLIESVNSFNIACQVLDDLLDWKQDLKGLIPSLLLTRVFEGKPYFSELETDKIAKLIYYKGHAQYILAIGHEAAEKSLKILNEIGGNETDWHELVLSTKVKIEALIEDFDAIVQKNIQRVKLQPKVELEIPVPENDCERVASAALNFVVEQWRKGLGEARHIMNLTQTDGFAANAGSSYRYGDVFQRALILETLCDVQSKLDVNLEPLIEYEIDYLLQKRRKDNIGGWAYFPDVLEIAADADDLGQILQAFVLADRKELALTYCEKPIKSLLKNNLLENGAVETWIVPKENRDAVQQIQHHYNLTKWGIGPDTEVVANFFYGLALYDQKRFEKIIKKAVNYLESVQLSDGSWDSRWYYGAFYGTFVCTRLIAKIFPDSPALTSASRFLVKSQNGNGGWGDQLNTSFAFLALSYCNVKNEKCVAAAVKFLKNSISEGWEEINFIKPRLGEPYKSQTITALYMCKAAAAWNNRLN